MLSLKAILTALALASYAIAAPAPSPQDLADGVIAYSTDASDAPDVNNFAATANAAATYKKTVLRHHNVHRANHSAPNVAWGPSMANWAQTVAESCIWRHNTYVHL